MRENSTELATVFAGDHEAFDEVQQGIHKQVTLLRKAEAPLPLAGAIDIFCMPGNLLSRKTAGTAINWTELINPDRWPLPANGQSNFKLPCGTIVKLGSNTVTENEVPHIKTIEFKGANPFTLAPYVFTSNWARDNTVPPYTVQIFNVLPGEFSVLTTQKNVTFTWFAIGE